MKFEPIVYLPEVEVPTHEENEEVLLKMRAKLYRFDTTNEETPEWKVSFKISFKKTFFNTNSIIVGTWNW